MSWLRHAAALLAGLLVGLAALLAHRAVPPLGLLVAVAATYALPLRLLRSRWPVTAATYVAGWLAVLVVAVVGRPEGDYVLAGDLAGYALMAAGLGLVLVAVLGLTGAARAAP